MVTLAIFFLHKESEMLIKKLILHKFKRFFLTGVEHFVYIPKDTVTILAWGNGMGKSSMLSQLSPLPADLKKDYNEDGYKIIELEDNGVSFKLSSGYVSKGKHSFLKNDIELNPGGTRAVQLQLVEEYFKITPSIFNIMLGIENLTSMSPVSRKNWFTMLSPVDYSFSINVWNSLRSRARDILGSIKIFQSEQTKKLSSLVDEKTLTTLSKKIKELESVTGLLTDEITYLEEKENTVDIETTLKQANKARELLIRLEEKYGNKDLLEINQLVGNIESEIKNIENQLASKQKLIKLLEHKDKESLENKKKSLVEEINNLENTVGKFNLERYKILLSYYRENEEKIINLVKYLQDSDLQSIGGSKELQKIKSDINILSKEIVALQASKLSLNHKIEEQANIKEHEVSCPNCKHTFYYTIDKDKLELAKKKVVEISTIILERETKIKSLNNLENKIVLKLEAIEKLTSLLSVDILKPYFINLTQDFSNFFTLRNILIVQLENLEKLYKLTIELEHIEQELKIQANSILLAKEAGIDTLDVLEQSIAKLSLDRSNCFTKLKELQVYKQVIEVYDKCIEHMKSYSSYQVYLYHKGINDTRNSLIKNIITDIKLEMSNIQKQLDDNKVADSVIKTLQSSIEDHKVRLSVLNKMVDVLSPESGLIAKSINSFLNIYLTEMNQLINSVWSYPMEILPCEIEDNTDLNYKFKVKVNHSEVIEDISKLSSSMQEIVNLAFRIVFVKYLNISRFPLVLDEFGKTMDAQHRVAAYDVIDKVLAHSFEHIVLVCHFESMYARFANATFLELVDSSTLK